MMRHVLFPLLVCLGLAACSSFHTPLDNVPLPSMPHGSSARGAERPLDGPAVSPNAEPLSGGILGYPDCDEAMAKWFDRVDTNHDGVIDHVEFLADARAQFARMDIDHDGFITADELTTYRMPYQGSGETKPGAKRQRASQAAAEGQEDPVMAADSNLDFKVSLAEFLALAEAKFAKLAPEGKLNRGAIDDICWPSPAKS